MAKAKKNTKVVEMHPWLASYPKELDWHKTYEVKPVYALLDDTAKKFPNNKAIDFLGKKYTYNQLLSLVNRTAKGLEQHLGIKKGTRVGLFLPNTPYFVICYYAILKLGGIVVNFNPLYAEREVAHQINDAEIEVMVTLDLKLLYDKLFKMIGKTTLQRLVICPMTGILPFPKNLLFPLVKGKEIAKIPQDKQHIPFDVLLHNDGKYKAVKLDPYEDLAVLQYTGGTTGTPKGAMLTHANLYVNAKQVDDWFLGREEGAERMLGVLPLFHVFAMTIVMNVSVSLGFEMVLLPRFELETTIKTIASKKITIFPAVPTIYNAINHFQALDKFNLSSLKIGISGGAPLSPEIKKGFEKKTNCVVVEGYGLSETSPVAVVNPLKGDNIPGSIGLPMPGTLVEIVSLEDRETVLGTKEKGEICLSGPQLMKGYWKKPEETDYVLKNGRFYTGDVGYIDERGYTFIVDRLKDVILCGGYNVYPRNVEEVIYLHPNVAECIVLGVPDQYRGQTVKAYVKLKEGTTLTLEELQLFLEDKISKIEIPKLLEVRDELPKTMIGKLSKKELYEEELAKQKEASA